jgi:hypothetical protein
MARLDALDPMPQVYVHWIKRFLLFHQQRQSQEMGAPETHTFLVYLALHDQGAATDSERRVERPDDDGLHTRAAVRWARSIESAQSALSSVKHRPGIPHPCANPLLEGARIKSTV